MIEQLLCRIINVNSLYDALVYIRCYSISPITNLNPLFGALVTLYDVIVIFVFLEISKDFFAKD